MSIRNSKFIKMLGVVSVIILVGLISWYGWIIYGHMPEGEENTKYLLLFLVLLALVVVGRLLWNSFLTKNSRN